MHCSDQSKARQIPTDALINGSTLRFPISITKLYYHGETLSEEKNKLYGISGYSYKETNGIEVRASEINNYIAILAGAISFFGPSSGLLDIIYSLGQYQADLQNTVYLLMR